MGLMLKITIDYLKELFEIMVFLIFFQLELLECLISKVIVFLFVMKVNLK